MDKKKNNNLFDLEFDLSEYECEYKGPLAGVYLNTSELAELFDVTPRTVRRWAEKDYIYRCEQNKWHVPEVIRGLYIAWKEIIEEYGGRL
jgi:hypothetical protein